ncbi:MAG: DNA replication and repair protein RecF [Spirochaetia bacterium]|nr:DNA replication and repair protein RecF [Spirochaetota bacterium]MDW8113106.1 DNA replication and repair protein RecF [Spirochaetia bacterium]
MRVVELVLRNFRLFESLELDFDVKNIVSGPNGSGKTTIIEAINYSSTFSPLRSYETDRELIKVGQNTFNITSKFIDDNGFLNTVFVGYGFDGTNYAKRIKVNDKNSNVINASGRLKAVTLLVEDYEIVVGSPSWRRKVIDNALISTDQSYYHYLINYNKILKQKNTILKTIKEKYRNEDNPFTDVSSLDRSIELVRTYNQSLSKFVVRITKYRYDIYNFLRDKLKGNTPISIDLKYKSNFVEIVKNSQNPEVEVSDLLNREIQREIMYGKSIVGPHLDDFIVLSNQKPARTLLSQGQIRLVSILFKIFLAEYIKSKTNMNPILLIDDVFGELDSNNRGKVFRIISELPYQVILSFFEKPEELNTKDFKIISLTQAT